MAAKEVPTKVFIGNVPPELSNDELRSLCENYGEVKECDVIKNYAFVHFAVESEAKSAMDALNGMKYGDKTLRAEMSKSSVRQKPGMGSKDGCFKCGGSGHWSKDCPSGSGRYGRRGGHGGGDRRYPPRDYFDDYDAGYYRRPRDDYYDDYYRRGAAYPPRDYYGGYRDRTPYSRPSTDYYSQRSSNYYGFDGDR